jgi:hypothetical protein
MKLIECLSSDDLLYGSHVLLVNEVYQGVIALLILRGYTVGNHHISYFLVHIDCMLSNQFVIVFFLGSLEVPKTPKEYG